MAARNERAHDVEAQAFARGYTAGKAENAVIGATMPQSVEVAAPREAHVGGIVSIRIDGSPEPKSTKMLDDFPCAPTGERPYESNNEGRELTATTPSSLIVPRRTHTDKRARPCNELGSTSTGADEGTLKSHLYECDDPSCAYTTHQASRLTAHKRMHTGDRPYACDFHGCGYRGSHQSILRAHQRTHSTDKPFKCRSPGCGYQAVRASSLKVHLRTHSGERPYLCDVPNCGFSAAGSCALNKHLLEHRPQIARDPTR